MNVVYITILTKYLQTLCLITLVHETCNNHFTILIHTYDMSTIISPKTVLLVQQRKGHSIAIL